MEMAVKFNECKCAQDEVEYRKGEIIGARFEQSDLIKFSSRPYN